MCRWRLILPNVRPSGTYLSAYRSIMYETAVIQGHNKRTFGPSPTIPFILNIKQGILNFKVLVWRYNDKRKQIQVYDSQALSPLRNGAPCWISKWNFLKLYQNYLTKVVLFTERLRVHLSPISWRSGSAILRLHLCEAVAISIFVFCESLRC